MKSSKDKNDRKSEHSQSEFQSELQSKLRSKLRSSFDESTEIPGRRTAIKVALGATVLGGGLSANSSHAQKPPEKMRPQPGDVLVHRFGDRKGQPIVREDVPGGAELLQASAQDPESGVMRDGSRLNGINVVQLNPDDFDEETAPYALDGVVAYSSVCTHQGCDLTQWLPDTRTFKCYCHYSEFDASKLGQPMHGPATRKLAILPLEPGADGQFQVADNFVGKVGFKKA